VGLSELDYAVGDLGAARQHLEQAAALGENAAMTENRFRWYVAMGRLVNAEGDPHEAIALLETAEQLYRPGFFPDVRPIAAIKARVWIAHGDLATAADWVRERGVAATDEAVYLREFDHLTLVRLLIARHRAHPDPDALGQALQLLARLRDAADASGRAGSLVEIRMLSALAQDAQGHRPQALETLRQAWAQSPEPDAYVRLFLDESTPMRELLSAAALQGVAGDHARRLLSFGASADVDATTSGRHPAQSPAEPLSERELQVLRLLDTDLTGPQIARELFVTLNTLRSHTKRIFTKLGVTTRRAAVRRARERGLM
jgi:LuxR family maltose regulon positive regulatory protein